jgi:hypothetical protein
LASLLSKLKSWVNSEVDKNLDKDGFSSLPLRMRIGIFLLMGSWLVGYGVPIILVWISRRNHQLSAAVVKGSLVYGICWVSGFIGLTLAGKDSIKYPIYFLAKLLKALFPKFFYRENESSSE